MPTSSQEGSQPRSVVANRKLHETWQLTKAYSWNMFNRFFSLSSLSHRFNRFSTTSRKIVLNTDQACANQGGLIAQYLPRVLREKPAHAPLAHANCIMLTGHVGAGKTTFARGLIRELSPPSKQDQDIPSPTFCLDFNYPLGHTNEGGEINRVSATPPSTNLLSCYPRGIHHLDLYRLTGTDPDDLQALDFTALTKEAITIVEWPDRLFSRKIVLEGALWVDIQLTHSDTGSTGSSSIDVGSNSNSNSNTTPIEHMTEEMFEQWISVPRHLVYTCSPQSAWSHYLANDANFKV